MKKSRSYTQFRDQTENENLNGLVSGTKILLLRTYKILLLH